MKYNRIIIIGSPGSGKSYLSKKLAHITGIPLIHLDNEFWNPGWVKTPKIEWVQKQVNMTSKEHWIMDGNYDSTLELRFMACDAVIFLDINPLICMLGAIVRHGRKRSDLPDYLEEKFDMDFIEFLRLIWNFSKTGRRTILALHETYPDKPFIILNNRRQVRKFILSYMT